MGRHILSFFLSLKAFEQSHLTERPARKKSHFINSGLNFDSIFIRLPSIPTFELKNWTPTSNKEHLVWLSNKVLL